MAGLSWLDFPVPPCQPEDHPAYPQTVSPGARGSFTLACLPGPLDPGANHLTRPLWLCFCRYCTEDSPSFPRPSLLESHISLMHGIRNPDLSQTSKARPSGGHSPQVSVGPLPTRAACSVRLELEGCWAGYWSPHILVAGEQPAVTATSMLVTL